MKDETLWTVCDRVAQAIQTTPAGPQRGAEMTRRAQALCRATHAPWASVGLAAKQTIQRLTGYAGDWTAYP